MLYEVITAALAAGSRWDLVFNIAEGLHGIGREAQVPAILDLYGIPYVITSYSIHYTKLYDQV